jgi:membrane-associated phospholipid phosphatase
MQLNRLANLGHIASLATAIGALFTVATVAPASLRAQAQAAVPVSQQGKPLPADSATASGQPLLRRPIVTSGDVFIAGALAATAAALIPADARIARELQRPSAQSSAAIRETAEGLEMIGSSGAVIFGASLYAVGLVTRKRGAADLGWHTLEAIAISTQATTALKGLFGRSRPYAAAGNARDFELGGGFGTSTRRSFPSGHTSMAFTLASVVSGETSQRWPHARKVVAPLVYAAATGVGLARMYNDKHWASDVALGAAIGTLSGRIVVRYAHGRPRNWVDRVALGLVGGRG